MALSRAAAASCGPASPVSGERPAPRPVRTRLMRSRAPARTPARFRARRSRRTSDPFGPPEPREPGDDRRGVDRDRHRAGARRPGLRRAGQGRRPGRPGRGRGPGPRPDRPHRRRPRRGDHRAVRAGRPDVQRQPAPYDARDAVRGAGLRPARPRARRPRRRQHRARGALRRPARGPRRRLRAAGHRLAGAGRGAVLPRDPGGADGRPAPPGPALQGLRRRRRRGRPDGAGGPAGPRGRRRRRADGGADPHPRRPHARHRRHHPAPPGRGDPGARARRHRDHRRPRHRQDRGRPAPRGVPALLRPAPLRGRRHPRRRPLERLHGVHRAGAALARRGDGDAALARRRRRRRHHRAARPARRGGDQGLACGSGGCWRRAARDVVPDAPTQFRAFVAGRAIRLEAQRARPGAQPGPALSTSATTPPTPPCRPWPSWPGPATGRASAPEFLDRFARPRSTSRRSWRSGGASWTPREVLLWLADRDRAVPLRRRACSPARRSTSLAALDAGRARDRHLVGGRRRAHRRPRRAARGPPEAPREERGFYEIEELDDVARHGVSEVGQRYDAPQGTARGYEVAPHEPA